MKTLLFLFLLVATTTAFSQVKFITTAEHEKVLKIRTGETKASRTAVVLAFEEWTKSQKYLKFEKLNHEIRDTVYRINDMEVSAIKPSYKCFYIAESNYKKLGHLYNADTTIFIEHTNIDGTKYSKIFQLWFEAEQEKDKTTFFINIFRDMYYSPEDRPKYWNEELMENTVPCFYLKDVILDAKNFIYKKVGK